MTKVVVYNTTSTSVFMDWFDRFRFSRKVTDMNISEWEFLKSEEDYNQPEALRDWFLYKLEPTIDLKYEQIGHKMWSEWIYYAFMSVDWSSFIKIAQSQSIYGLYDSAFAKFELPKNHELPPRGSFKNIDLNYAYILDVHLGNDEDLRKLITSKSKLFGLIKSELTFNLATTGDRFYFKNLEKLVEDRAAREQYRKLLKMFTKDIWAICIGNKFQDILKERIDK